MNQSDRPHVPVLLAEFLEIARPQSGDRWVDGTFGRGGHTEALLRRGALVLAMDRDEAAAGAAEELRHRWPGQFWFKRDDYRNMRAAVQEIQWESVQGVLLDLGVSSPQLDAAERGFSFRQEGPLDMRMDARQSFRAADAVNGFEEKQLAAIFREHGDERDAGRIARAIVRAREQGEIRTTTQLAEVVAEAVPWRKGRGIHPATKVFQALRMEVNDETGGLEEVLPEAASLLAPGGVLAVISFHSGEDRRVKYFLREHSERERENPKSGIREENPGRWFERPVRAMAGEEECEGNPRSRSARLRVARKIGG